MSPAGSAPLMNTAPAARLVPGCRLPKLAEITEIAEIWAKLCRDLAGDRRELL
jgi:hypothetical protein